MEMFVDIFQQLGTDKSIVHQFIIIIVMFYLTKFLFINHLHEIISKREDNTVGLEGNAEKQFEEIDKIQNEYKDKIQNANKEIKSMLDNDKMVIVKTHEAKYREQETEINKFIETSRKKIEEEINEKKI